MVSVRDALVWIYSQLYIHMFPDGDVGGLTQVPGGGGGNCSKVDGILSPPPRPTRMSAGDLFRRISTGKWILINVNVLAVVSAVVIGVQALLASRRRRSGSNNAFVSLLLWVFYSISYPVVSGTIGLIPSIEKRVMPDVQKLWAVVLLLLLGSVDGMSVLERQEILQRNQMLANHAVQALLVLWLLYSRSDVSDGGWVLLAYFLLCWIYAIFRIAQRMTAMRIASSAQLMRSAMVVADYMKDIVRDTEHDPKNMSECKYLVKDFNPPSMVGPPYLTANKAVTVDMIWKHNGRLLRSGGSRCDGARALKHTCLSFALFKLLKRRFCGDLDIAEASDQKSMEFVVDGLLADDYEHAFRVVEVELSFLYDFFYTKYPALFPTSRLLGFIRFLVLLGFFKVLLVDSIKEGLPPDYHTLEHTIIYFNNLLLVAMILSIDILQHLAVSYSNWAIVHFVCDYVINTKQRWWKRRRGFCVTRGWLIKRVAEWRWQQNRKWWSPRCWDNKLGQYSLLKSYDYSPVKKNALSRLSLGMMEPPVGRGRRQEPAVPLTAEVKKAVLYSLKKTRGLPCVGRFLNESARHLQLHWACNLPTHTHTVLVWHIATTMCDLDDGLQDTGIRSNVDVARHVATTLSGYCAYLLAFVPDMLPDKSYKARHILDAVVEEARVYIGGTVDMDMLKRCEIMFELRAEKLSSSEVQVFQDTPILIQAAQLGRQLRCGIDRPQRWELLAAFWAELVLFLAPSNNADVHAEHLATGGEFITHLWALLTHAGIVERPLHAYSLV